MKKIAPHKSEKKPPLQVALICESSMQPAWVLSIIIEIQQSQVAEISSVICWEESTKYTKKLPFLYKVFRQIDHNLYKEKADPQTLAPVKSVLDDVTVQFVRPHFDGGYYKLDDRQVCALKLDSADVAIYFGLERLTGPALKAPKYGLWAYGGGYDQRHQAEGMWTVLEGTSTTSSGLWILAVDPSMDKAIYRSFASTNKQSMLLNECEYLWKTARFTHRKLVDLFLDGEQALRDVRRENQRAPTANKYQAMPRNMTMFAFYLRQMLQYFRAKLNHLTYEPQWMIAYGLDGAPFIQGIPWKNLSYLKPPPGRQWADPFPWVQDGRACIFVEEIPSPGAKGHIAVFDVTNPLKEVHLPTIVLKAEYHLSYPFLFAYRGELYLLPDSYHNGTIDVYRCKKFPNEWEFHTCIFEDIKAADTTLVKANDVWWMFTNIAGASFNDELYLYYAESPFGPWKPHRKNPIVSDVSQARPAGNLFFFGGNFYRPSQDCSISYGYSISINRILNLTTNEFSEECICKILPNWHPNLLATHTLNHHRDLIVLDGLWRRRKIFSWIG